MLYLDAITKNPSAQAQDGFPFNLPALKGLDELRFERPVTFFIGENGSGKSTLIEAIAAGINAVAVGAADIGRDPTLVAPRALAKTFRFARRHAPKTKLFFRAEDAFGFTKRVIENLAELESDAQEMQRKFRDGSYGQKLAVGAVRGQKRALEARYGANPDGYSHGETFLEILKSRLVPGGLYLLDEPETPLSPIRILALMSLMKDCVDESCQFIIATHSPILMAYPDAQILEFSERGIHPVEWLDTEHVSITRSVLADPEGFLRKVWWREEEKGD